MHRLFVSLFFAWALLTQPSPVRAQSPAGRTGGLRGEYFNGPNFEQKVHTQIDRQIDFNWYGQRPAPGVQAEYFSVRWTGKLYAPVGGTYRFTATVDDGVRIWVGGRKVIDEWRKQDDTRFVGEINLNAKQVYDLKVEYYNDWKGSVISVFWEPPAPRQPFFSLNTTSNRRTVIPAQYLFSESPKPLKLQPIKKPTALPAAVRLPVAAKPAAPKPPQRTAGRLTAFRSVGLVAGRKPLPAKALDRSAAAPPSTDSLRTQPTFPIQAPVLKQVPVESAGVPTVAPENVFFAQSDYALLPESVAVLDKLLRTLQTNAAFRVTISGHTDNVGDGRLNQTLSEYRARVVANYFVQRGIAPDRLTTQGYGGAQPVRDNANEQARVRNRRVVITLH